MTVSLDTLQRRGVRAVLQLHSSVRRKRSRLLDLDDVFFGQSGNRRTGIDFEFNPTEINETITPKYKEGDETKKGIPSFEFQSQGPRIVKLNKLLFNDWGSIASAGGTDVVSVSSALAYLRFVSSPLRLSGSDQIEVEDPPLLEFFFGGFLGFVCKVKDLRIRTVAWKNIQDVGGIPIRAWVDMTLRETDDVKFLNLTGVERDLRAAGLR